MTQQSEADDGRDDAATDAVGYGIHASRQDASSGARDDQGRACDTKPVPTRQPSLHVNDAPSAWMPTALVRLESAFLAFSFAIAKAGTARGLRRGETPPWPACTPSLPTILVSSGASWRWPPSDQDER